MLHAGAYASPKGTGVTEHSSAPQAAACTEALNQLAASVVACKSNLDHYGHQDADIINPVKAVQVGSSD